MQKRKDDTVGDGIFTSTFHVTDRGPGSYINFPLRSDVCGLGWTFGLTDQSWGTSDHRFDSDTPDKMAVSIYPQLVGSFWQGLQYHILVTVQEQEEDDNPSSAHDIKQKSKKKKNVNVNATREIKSSTSKQHLHIVLDS